MTHEHILIALTNPTDGREDEFNDWYERTHVPECLRVPGFKSGRRYRLTAVQGEPPRQGYLALYELEGDDPQELLDRLLSTRDDRTQNGSIDLKTMSLWVYSALGQKHTASET